MPALALLLLFGGTAPAIAHGVEVHGEWPVWTFDPWVITPLLMAAGLYAAGSVRLWRRSGGARALRMRQAGLYALGWLALAGALVSPLHWLGEHMFTFHMIEHEIVMAIAAPLLALSRPAGAALWALPKGLRQAFAMLARSRAGRSLWRGLTRPASATLVHGVALWIWHAPGLLDATVTDVVLHRLQHLSFFLSALLFWWALVRRADAGTAAAHVFLTMLHMSALGALIALSPRLLYPVQTAEAQRWGLTPMEDQQLAGLVMWVPAGTVYAAAALVFAGMWISRSSLTGRAADAPVP